jgi:small-conductance mechanosensitive channel
MKWENNVLIAVAGVVLLIIIAAIVQHFLARRVADPHNKARMRWFVWVVAVYAMVLLVSSVFRSRLGQVGLAVGLIGAGAAVAFQEVIASIAGWLTILLAGFYRVGDRVDVGGIQGDVIEIGVLRTRLMEIGDWVKGDLYNGRVVFVTNGFIFKAPVYNYSGKFEFLWDELTLPVRYDSDTKLARQFATSRLR